MTIEDAVAAYPRLLIRPNRDLDHLPGDYGMPIVGRTLEAVMDVQSFMRRMHEQYGPVCRTYTFAEHRVLLLDPDAIGNMLMDRERNFSSLLGWERFVGRFFPRGLMLRDFDDHRLHRLILQEAL